MKKLIVLKMSKDAVSANGGSMDAINLFLEPGKLAASARAATEWAEMAVRLVRTAAEPNEWKDADPEVIAGQILAKSGFGQPGPEGQ